jgi:hypothetical protein
MNNIAESTYTATRKSYRMKNGYQIIATKVNNDTSDVCVMEGANISVRTMPTNEVDKYVQDTMSRWGNK